MTQLEQILGYLDRDGVTEVIIAVGQPIQFRRNGAMVPLTNAQLTRIQVTSLVANTPLSTVFGKRGEGELQIGKRSLKVTATGTADAPILSIVKAPAPVAPQPAIAPVVTERTRRPSKQPKTERGGSPTKPPRTRSNSRGIDLGLGAATPVTPASPAKPPNKLTMSDIKFAPPGTRREEPPPPRGPELDPPGAGFGARGLSLELDDDRGIELGAPGATLHHGSTPALDQAFSGPPKPRPAPAPLHHMGSTPAIDDAFGGPRPAPISLDDMLPPRKPAPVVPAVAPVAPVGSPVAIAAPAPSTPRAPLPPALRALLEDAARHQASDLHVLAGRPACARVLGELAPLRPDVLDKAAVEAMLLPLLDDRGRAQLEQAGYADLAIEMPSGARLRTNIARCQGGLRGTFRIARPAPPTLDELGLPRELAKVVNHHQGLVVVSGPSGHGKTTTLAALVDLVNTAHAHHIITVEDPIEIVYPRKAAVVSQREVGAHTRSFAAALKGSLREDPDVIVIGELRDRETVEIALTAAETGHLVLATMSTPSAAKTIDRLVDMFPPDDQSQVRASIAGALRAIVSQRLLPAQAGNGVVAAVELVTGVLPLANLIRDDKLFQLPSLMQRGKAFGMIRLDDSLIELVRANKITTETALAASDNRKELATRLSQGTSSIPMQPRKP